MFRRTAHLLINEYTVFGIFIAIVSLGLLYGGVRVLFSSAVSHVTQNVIMQTPQVLSVQDYKRETRDILIPFLTQAKNIKIGENIEDPSLILGMIQTTQDRLLRLRVPREFLDTHLSFVLLLDQWKRAMNGSRLDQKIAQEKTQSALKTNPWLDATKNL